MKNYKKFTILAATFGALAFATNFATPASSGVISEERVLKSYIVEFDNSLVGNEDKVIENQEFMLSRLRSRYGSSFILKETFTKSVNAIVIETNSTLADSMSNFSGISRVNEDKTYRFSNDEASSTESISTLAHMDGNDDSDYTLQDAQKTNYSAETMKIPTTSTQGSNTIIAILDASFAVDPTQRAVVDGVAQYKASNDFAHSWFKDLDNSVVRYSKDEMLNLVNQVGFNGKPAGGVAQGEYTSTYLNNKIPFYYDYGGDSNLGHKNDYDVYSQYDEHGTHVASIAAANGDVYKGIAPNAQLALMKVFRENYQETDGKITASTGAADSDIIEALEDCVALGVDCVNMSLGSDLDDFSSKSTSITAFKNLKKLGCSVNISAGNGGKGLYSSMGPYANWSTDSIETGVLGSYANDSNSMIIASTNLEKNYYEDALIVSYQARDDEGNISTKEQPVSYKDEAKSKATQTTTPDELKLNSLITTLGKTEFDYCVIPEYGRTSDYNTFKSSQAEGFSFKDKIAVVDRGDISFSNKATYAADQGCAALVVVNNDPTATDFTFGMAWGDSTGYTFPTIPVVFALYRDRTYFQNANNGLGKLTIAQKMIADNPNADEMSDYSSDGATYDLRINPEISAPGASVLGAVPGKADSNGKYEPNTNAWAYLSGTSMSAPNYTGAVALMVGEKTKDMTEEKRLAYKKTISMRTMTTADQYTENNTHPITGKTVEKDVMYSPRRQGAGEVNVTDAISSDIYFEGLESKTNGKFGETGTTKAKVELKYNDLVRDGKISLSFLAHNEGTTSRNYKATLYVMKPETKSYFNYENHKSDTINYETGEVTESSESTHGSDYEFEGSTFQTNHDTVIATKEFDKTIPVGTSTISGIEYELTTEEKARIDADFKNGTYLEGYVVFTPTDTVDTIKLSIPYLGFYGSSKSDDKTVSKYETASAIEEFDFEKANSDQKYYPSDLVNYVGTGTSLNLPNMDISSTIVSMSKEQYLSMAGTDSILYNKGNIKNVGNQVTYDSKTNTIYAGGDTSDVLYVQTFVLRSISDNSIVLKDSNGKTVYTTGDTNLVDSINGTTYLYKSHVGSSYVNSNIIAHRGRAVLPLYQQSNRNAKLPDGNYTLTFNMTVLGSNTLQTKSYNLVLDSKLPVSQTKETVKKNGEDYLRLKYSETYLTLTNTQGLTAVAINGGVIPFDLSRYNGGYYLDIKLSDIYANNESGKVTVNIEDGAGNKIFDIFYLGDSLAGRVTVESTELAAGAEVNRTVTDNKAETKFDFDSSYVLTYKDGSGLTYKMKSSYYVFVSLKGMDLSTAKVFEGTSTEDTIEYEVVGDSIKFKTSTGKFRIQATASSDKGASYPSLPAGAAYFLAIGLPIIVVAGLGVALYFFVFKKKFIKATKNGAGDKEDKK